MGDITSANSVFILVVPILYPSGIQLQAYSAERAWETAERDASESQMGVDGTKAAGYVPTMVSQTVSLLANSTSKQVFLNVYNYMKANRVALPFSGSITLPATGETFIGTNGTLKSFKPLPDAAKVLQPQSFVIEWQDLAPSLA